MTEDEDKMMAEVINLLLFAPLEFSLLSFPARATTSAIYLEEQLNRNSTSPMHIVYFVKYDDTVSFMTLFRIQ